MLGWIKTKGVYVLALLVILLSVALVVDKTSTDISGTVKSLTVGLVGETYAAAPDYTCDGVADESEFTTAIAALPAGGGEIVILSGAYTFATTVTPGKNNVTIRGVGKSAAITTTGVTAPFNVTGLTGWVFSNFSCDDNLTYDSSYGVTSGTVIDGLWIGGIYTVDKPSPETGVRTASYIIAASNAPAREIAQADAVCDGTADQVEIQAAIDAGFRDIKLSYGTFHTSCEAGGYHIVGANYLKISGAGIDRTTIIMDLPRNGVTDTWLRYSYYGMEVSDFTLDMSAFSDGTRNVWGVYCGLWRQYGSIHDVEFYYPDAGAIYFTNMNNFEIYNCQFTGRASSTLSPQQMIRLTGGGGTYDIKVHDCTFWNFYLWGILTERSDAQCYNLTATNNFFKTSYNTAHLAEGIYLQWPNSVITGNRFQDMSGCAIQVSISPSGDSETVISNNIMLNCGTDGFSPAIYASDTTVLGDHLIISNNVIRAGATGGSDQQLDIRGLASPVITGNTVIGRAGIAMNGLHLTGCSNAIVSNNVFDTFDSSGIKVDVSAGFTVCDNMTISHNSILNCGEGLGISNDAHDGFVVEGNIFETNSSNMVIGASAINLLVRNNIGYVTESDGTESILNTTTSVHVHHGLSATPTIINITFTENSTNPIGHSWISDIGADNFTVNVNTDPGASNLDFWWEARAW